MTTVNPAMTPFNTTPAAAHEATQSGNPALSARVREQDIGIGRQEKTALNNAVKSALVESGLNGMSMRAFYQSMMLDPDGDYTLDDAL
ncbi:hypothetical protein D9O50_01925 [Oxalobacteraceae bacterium CAVE-383]|nr:hypothetical protein D9O50_01925 [Oxalobacteraceae bacterium CAVE-383]